MRTTIPATMLREGDRAYCGTGPSGLVVSVTRPFGTTNVMVLLDSGARFLLRASTILPIDREETDR